MPPPEVDHIPNVEYCDNIVRWTTQEVILKHVHECESFDPGLYLGLLHSKDICLKYAQNFGRESVCDKCLETLLTSES